MSNFLVNVPWGINQGDFRASWSWNLCFWSLKRFGRFEAVASLDAYQITNYQFPSKTHHFLLPNFRRIWEEVSKSGILWPNAWAGMIKRFIWFFKNCAPRGTKVSYSNGFKTKRSVYRDEFITNSNPQFFQDPRSNIWKTFSFSFSFFCADFMIMKFIPF